MENLASLCCPLQGLEKGASSDIFGLEMLGMVLYGPMKSYGSSSGAPGTIEEYGCP